jgi:hypothetical protein
MKDLSRHQQRAVIVLRRDGMPDEEIEVVLSLDSGALRAAADAEVYDSGIFFRYQDLAIRTESLLSSIPSDQIRALHGILGMTSELSELQGALDKDDPINLVEELGDLMWYVAITCDSLGLQLHEMVPAGQLIDPDLTTEEVVRTYLIWNLAELTDQVKKQVYYRKPFDFDEAARHLQSIVAAVDTLLPDDANMRIALHRNIDKLKARYPEGFTSANALERDLGSERQALSG